MKKGYVVPAMQVTLMDLGYAIASATGVSGEGIDWGGVDEGGGLDPDANSRGDWEEDFWEGRE